MGHVMVGVGGLVFAKVVSCERRCDPVKCVEGQISQF